MTAKRTIVVTLGLAVVAAATTAFLAFSSSPKSAALAAREHAMEMLGARIAKLRPESKVLALSNPFTKESGYLNEKSQFERAGLRGLRKGLADVTRDGRVSGDSAGIPCQSPIGHHPVRFPHTLEFP